MLVPTSFAAVLSGELARQFAANEGTPNAPLTSGPGRGLIAVLMMALLAAGVEADMAQGAPQSAGSRPNIVVILTDDQGYADISFNPHHPAEISTPHMEALAREGVFFSQAYISGAVCSPTRAGLMLGRYQQRVGVYTAGEGGRGFDPSIPIFPARLPDDYVSSAIGKWHLGLDEDYPQLKWHPVSRGFDESYNFMGRGGHDYFQLSSGGTEETAPLYRGKQRIDDSGYLTTRLAEEAVDFIERRRAEPFFLYLAFNAVHAPQQAPPETLARVQREHPALSESRQLLVAMLYHLDEGIGAVVEKLKSTGEWENTLLFFLTDNGGSKAISANNAPLRGFKQDFYEGGIRTPFVVSWPARFAGGRVIDTPVISLDILPTCLDAVGALEAAQSAGGTPGGFDGRSLLPLLTGEVPAETRLHETLFWSSGGGEGEWAVRSGDWKLRAMKGGLELFHLGQDPGETTNLAEREPQQLERLTALYDGWLDQMAEPMTPGVGKRWGATPAKPAALTPREEQREAERLKKKAAREAAKKAEKKGTPMPESKSQTGAAD